MSRRVGYRHATVVIGEPAEQRAECADYGTYIDPTATLEAFVTVDGGTYQATWIGTDTWLMKHVHIGHDCRIYEGCELAPGAVICGECVIGPGVKIGAGAVLRPRVKVGQRARIGAGAVVTKDVPPGEVWAGNPARRLESLPCTCPRDIEPGAYAVGCPRHERAYQMMLEVQRSSSAPEHTTVPTPSRQGTSTSTATSIAGPEASSPATAADAEWQAWWESRGTPRKPTTLPKRPPGGFIEPSGLPARSSAHSRVDL